MTLFLPAYWRGGDGWFADRAEGMAGQIGRHPGGERAFVPVLIWGWAFAVAALLAALMTVGGFANDDDLLMPGVLASVSTAVVGFGLQQLVIWFNRPTFLVPPRWRDETGEWELRRQRRARRSASSDSPVSRTRSRARGEAPVPGLDVERLLTAALDVSKTAKQRSRAASGLGRCADDPRVIHAVVSLLDDPVEEVRDEAYGLVDGSAYVKVWPVLERHVGSEDWLARLHALSAMWRVDPSRALPFAQRLRRDEEGLVRDVATDMVNSLPG
ncbi:hypothetical protein [Promicromonospora sp. NPDC050249]|uniref:HEAT repeat domain-containing protein n=1 Tax=Promicromonospora sp. NPDC050249 TaxID=3154743 RepID=UPI003402C781